MAAVDTMLVERPGRRPAIRRAAIFVAANMTTPLWILAGLAVVAGGLNLPHIIHPPWSLESAGDSWTAPGGRWSPERCGSRDG